MGHRSRESLDCLSCLPRDSILNNFPSQDGRYNCLYKLVDFDKCSLEAESKCGYGLMCTWILKGQL